MNIVLWVLQGSPRVSHRLRRSLEVRELRGDSEETVPSLSALPHKVWLALGVVELLVGLAFVVPALHGSMAILAPIAAGRVAAEMLMFSAVHFSFGDKNHGLVAYWLVVAAICAFVAYGRFALAPL